MSINQKLLFFPPNVHARIMRDEKMRKKNNHKPLLPIERIEDRWKPPTDEEDSQTVEFKPPALDKDAIYFYEVKIEKDGCLRWIATGQSSIRYKSKGQFFIGVPNLYVALLAKLKEINQSAIPPSFVFPDEVIDLNIAIALWNTGVSHVYPDWVIESYMGLDHITLQEVPCIRLVKRKESKNEKG